MTSGVIIAVNGHAATGKGTLSRMLASALSIPHYDFGLIFRALAHAKVGQDWPSIHAMISGGRLRLVRDRFFLDGLDITEGLKSEGAGLLAAELATCEEQAFVVAAKSFITTLDFIVDGRTVSQAFPDAKWHFQIVSNAYTAKQRRVTDGGDGEIFDRRRELDQNRVTAALTAITIDTTGKSATQSLAEILGYISSREYGHGYAA